jgi:hypothetical protein
MRASAFDEAAFFRAVQDSGTRALLIGRRALVLLGLPVLTADYDFWIDVEAIDRFNMALASFELHSTHTPDEARARGRYALENDERIDVLVARGVPTVQGLMVRFDDVWARRRSLDLGEGTTINLPSIDDLILTKQFASRPKDLEDIRLLQVLKTEEPRG